MNSMPVAKARSWSESLLLLVGDDSVDSQLGVLDANLGHVQRDVTEIKNDQRRAGDKLDDMNGRLDLLRDKIDQVGGDANKRIDSVAEKVTDTRTDITVQLENVRKELSTEISNVRKELSTEITNVRKELTTEVNGIRTDLSQKIETIRGELFVVKSAVSSAKVWTLTLQITIAAGLLGVIAHGFKWI